MNYQTLKMENTMTLERLNQAKYPLILMIFLIITGCMHPLGLDKNTVQQLSEGQTPIHLAHQIGSPFEIHIIAHHLIIIGGIEDEKAVFDLTGEDWVKQYQLIDPVIQIQNCVYEELPLKIPHAIIYQYDKPLISTDLDDLTHQFNKGLVLEFKTTEWELTQLPFSLRNVGLYYSAEARLIQLGEQPKVLGSTLCQIKLKGRWTLQELQADDGTLLKEKLNLVAEQCASQFLKGFKAHSSPVSLRETQPRPPYSGVYDEKDNTAQT